MIYDDQLDEGTWRRDINSNDCIDCLLLLTMTMKTDLYIWRADYIWRVREFVTNPY